jgi:hypothetical protein
MNIPSLEDRDAELSRCTNDLDLEAMGVPGDHHVIELAFPQCGSGVRQGDTEMTRKVGIAAYETVIVSVQKRTIPSNWDFEVRINPAADTVIAEKVDAHRKTGDLR